MSLHCCFKSILFFTLAFVGGLSGGILPVSAQTPELIIEVGHVKARPGETVLVPVYLSNYQDSVAAFSFMVQMDRPGIGTFSVGPTHDTLYWKCLAHDGMSNCIDSTLSTKFGDYDFITIDSLLNNSIKVDSSGTMTSGWKHLKGNSLGGQYFDAKVVALANMAGKPIVTGIGPQENGLLFYLSVDLSATPDPFAGDTLNLIVDGSQNTAASTPLGGLIGYAFQTYIDTSYYSCIQWAGETCVGWQQVAGAPYDSVAIVLDSTYVRDETAFQIIDGSITLTDCGFVGQGPDIVQLTNIVDFLFGGQDIHPPLNVADCDCSCEIDIIDLTTAVDYLFDSAPLPGCAL